MTAEEVNKYFKEQHTVEEYRDCLQQYFEGYLAECFSGQKKTPYSEHIRMGDGKTGCVISFELRRKHKKRRIQKKWAKRYGYKPNKAFFFPIPTQEYLKFEYE